MQATKRISIADALQLDIPERIRLVEAIWESVAEVSEARELTGEQRQELDRRNTAYEADPQGGSSWSEVKERIVSLRGSKPREGSVAP